MRASPRLDPPTRAPRTADLRRRWALVAVVAGLALGPLDLLGQVVAPYPWAHLFNSPAVRAAAAFFWGRWIRNGRTGPVGGMLLLVVAVEAYYLADVLVRGADPSNPISPTAVVWLMAAVAAGTTFGLAGNWAVDTTGARAVLGRAALPAVFGGEAVHTATRLATEPADGRPSDLGELAVLLTVIAVLALVALVRGLPGWTAATVTGLAAFAALVLGMVAATLV